MGIVETRLLELGIELPEMKRPVANYVPVVRTGNLLFLSGSIPASRQDGSEVRGKLGDDLSVEEGYEAARLVGINLIAVLKATLGDLDRVVQIVKLLTMVNSTQDFVDTPAVANGCSDLLVEVFGDKGKHARSAVGMASLPLNVPVETEMVVEIAS
ncbi:MAG: RidA family protein [Chloroflexota bacterium]|nr:RidA family protein [Chloroflexota bacterium]